MLCKRGSHIEWYVLFGLVIRLVQAALPQKSAIAVGSGSVPPAVAGGSTVRIQNPEQYRMLIIDPPATAGGTDIDPSTAPDF